MLPIACNCLELITLIMYKQILSECISKSFSGTSFRGTHGEEHTLISNSAIVEVLLTLTDNSNYFSECAFWSLPNMSWQIIKKTSGLFDTKTKYKGVFLATGKGCQLCSGEISELKIMYVHVLPVVRKSWIKIQSYVGKLLNIQSGRFFECFMRLQNRGMYHGIDLNC